MQVEKPTAGLAEGEDEMFPISENSSMNISHMS